MPIIQIEVSDFTYQINQEIKEKGLTSKDAEYFRLKVRESRERKYPGTKDCPICGKTVSTFTLEKNLHRCRKSTINKQ